MKKNMLALAISITAHAFEEKTDAHGKPYMLHCLWVMNEMDSGDEELMCIAVMHDLVEDCAPQWDCNELRKLGFSERVVGAIDLLTHKEGEYYDLYIKRVATNKDAKRVKLKDLEHNTQLSRLKGLRQSDFERMEKYHKAYVYLSS